MPTLEENLQEHVIRPMAKATWWSIVVRGILALVFGAIVLSNPAIGLAALVITFGVYSAVDGITALVTAVGHGRSGQSWGWWLVEGLVSLAVAALAFARPGVTVLAMVLLIAFRAIAMGIFELGGAIAGRGHDHRWILALTGIVSLVFGVLLIAEPLVGGVALMWAVGMYAVIFGVMLIGVGFRALWLSREHGEPGEPQGGYMRPAHRRMISAT